MDTLYSSQRRQVEFEPQTMETVDRAVRDWFDKTVDAHVTTQSQDRSKVRVVFSAGERIALGRRGIRDAQGMLILPIISIRRSGVEQDLTMSALGAQTGKLTIARRVSEKSSDLVNAVQRVSSAGIPVYSPSPPVVYEVASIPFPERNVFSYELVIQASYTLQMNSILEKLFSQLDVRKSFVAPFQNDGKHSLNGEDLESRKSFKGGYACGFFETTFSDQSNFDEFTDQERIVKYSTTFRVPANLHLEVEGEKPSVSFEKTAYTVGFKERVVSAAEGAKIFGQR